MKKSITYRRLTAGQPGTKSMVEKYGDKLVYIRYRYDADKKVKYKTVEIIEDSGVYESKKRDKRDDEIVDLKIAFNENDLRERVKQAGAIWNRDKKVWEISYKRVKKLGLEDRILG